MRTDPPMPDPLVPRTPNPNAPPRRRWFAVVTVLAVLLAAGLYLAFPYVSAVGQRPSWTEPAKPEARLIFGREEGPVAWVINTTEADLHHVEIVAGPRRWSVGSIRAKGSAITPVPELIGWSLQPGIYEVSLSAEVSIDGTRQPLVLPLGVISRIVD